MYRTDQPWNRKGFLKIMAIVLVLSAATAGYAADDEEDLKWWNPPEVSLMTVVPWGHQTALQPRSGWALTLHMTAIERRMQGIGKETYPPLFPGLDLLGNGDNGWLVFEDPDGCPSFLPFQFQQNVYADAVCGGGSLEWPDCHPEPMTPYACPPDANLDDLEPWDFDETTLQFRPGVAVPDPDPAVEDQSPNVWQFAGTEWQLKDVGPLVGSPTDLIRYGRSELIPGLVILADHGPALLTRIWSPYSSPPYTLPWTGPGPTQSTFFDPPDDPPLAWNLAGHVNTLGYTMLANVRAWPGWGQTTVTAQLIAQKDLFTPVVLIDRDITKAFVDDYGDDCLAGDGAYRMDGGPLTCYPGSANHIDPIVNEVLITLRVFVVSGEAPDKIEDMNRDGIFDMDDVKAMGYDPITREEVVTFYQHNELSCGYTYDFDGDGMAGQCWHGARAGGITGVPR